MASAAVLDVHTQFHIAANHPALPGHFPDAPVVPGVLLLAESLQQLETRGGHKLGCHRIERAKFLQPVAPGETISASLRLEATGKASLDLHVGDRLVAQATVLLWPPAHEPARA
jgi:3-hydroxymyristoyl/3-hydroxydecanoyl-(acyl carrier protein) dehydratase